MSRARGTMVLWISSRVVGSAPDQDLGEESKDAFLQREKEARFNSRSWQDKRSSSGSPGPHGVKVLPDPGAVLEDLEGEVLDGGVAGAPTGGGRQGLGGCR